MIAFPLPAVAAELPAGVQQILQQSELTPDKLVHITLQELLQTLAGWLKNAWGQPLQLARRAVLFLLLSSCVGLLADGGAWRDCVDLVAVLGFWHHCAESNDISRAAGCPGSQHQPVGMYPVLCRYLPG